MRKFNFVSLAIFLVLGNLASSYATTPLQSTPSQTKTILGQEAGIQLEVPLPSSKATENILSPVRTKSANQQAATEVVVDRPYANARFLVEKTTKPGGQVSFTARIKRNGIDLTTFQLINETATQKPYTVTLRENINTLTLYAADGRIAKHSLAILYIQGQTTFNPLTHVYIVEETVFSPNFNRDVVKASGYQIISDGSLQKTTENIFPSGRQWEVIQSTVFNSFQGRLSKEVTSRYVRNLDTGVGAWIYLSKEFPPSGSPSFNLSVLKYSQTSYSYRGPLITSLPPTVSVEESSGLINEISLDTNSGQVRVALSGALYSEETNIN